jgi:hypothetical protein
MLMTRIHHAVLDLPPQLAAQIRATGNKGPLLAPDSRVLLARDSYVTRVDPARPAQPCRD